MDAEEFTTLDEVGADSNDEDALYLEPALAQSLVEKAKDAPVLGLQYVLEIQPSCNVTLETCSYICTLCSKKMSSATLVAHIKSVPHRLKYAETNLGELHRKFGTVELKQWTSTLVKEFTSCLEEVEKRQGRKPIAVANDRGLSVADALSILKSQIAKDKKRVSSGKGPSKPVQNSKQNVRFPRRGRILVRRAIPPLGRGSTSNIGVRKEIKAPSRSPVPNTRPGIQGRTAPARPKSPISRVRSPLRKSGSPARRGRSPARRVPSPKRGRSPAPRSRSPIKRDRTPPVGSRSPLPRKEPLRSSHSPRRFRPHIHSRSPPRYRSPGRRKASPRLSRDVRRKSRSRSPMARRRPRTRSRSPARRRGNLGKRIEEFRSAEESLNMKHQADVSRHHKAPETHPLYKREWEKFWERRYRELELEGRNPKSYNYEDEWVKLWIPRMNELEKKEYELSRKSLLLKFGLEESDLTKGATRTKVRDRSLSPWESKRNKSKVSSKTFPKKPVYEDSFSVTGTLQQLKDLEDHLGSFGPAVVSLLKKAQEINGTGNRPLELFADSDNTILLKLAKDKLNNLVSTGALGDMLSAQIQRAIEAAAWLQREAEGAFCTRKRELYGLSISNLSYATKGMDAVQIAQHIASELLKIGRSNVSESQLQEILCAISECHVQMTETMKQILTVLPSKPPMGVVTKSITEDFSLSSSENNPQFGVASYPVGIGAQPFKNNFSTEKSGCLFPSGVEKVLSPFEKVVQQKEKDAEAVPSKTNGLSLLQSAYEEKSKDLDTLPLEELQKLLENFRNLSAEEQDSLTGYLKKLEATNSKKVNKLRERMRQSSKAKSVPTIKNAEGKSTGSLQVQKPNLSAPTVPSVNSVTQSLQFPFISQQDLEALGKHIENLKRVTQLGGSALKSFSVPQNNPATQETPQYGQGGKFSANVHNQGRSPESGRPWENPPLNIDCFEDAFVTGTKGPPFEGVLKGQSAFKSSMGRDPFCDDLPEEGGFAGRLMSQEDSGKVVDRKAFTERMSREGSEQSGRYENLGRRVDQTAVGHWGRIQNFDRGSQPGNAPFPKNKFMNPTVDRSPDISHLAGRDSFMQTQHSQGKFTEKPVDRNVNKDWEINKDSIHRVVPYSQDEIHQQLEDRSGSGNMSRLQQQPGDRSVYGTAARFQGIGDRSGSTGMDYSGDKFTYQPRDRPVYEDHMMDEGTSWSPGAYSADRVKSQSEERFDAGSQFRDRHSGRSFQIGNDEYSAIPFAGNRFMDQPVDRQRERGQPVDTPMDRGHPGGGTHFQGDPSPRRDGFGHPDQPSVPGKFPGKFEVPPQNLPGFSGNRFKQHEGSLSLSLTEFDESLGICKDDADLNWSETPFEQTRNQRPSASGEFSHPGKWHSGKETYTDRNPHSGESAAGNKPLDRNPQLQQRRAVQSNLFDSAPLSSWGQGTRPWPS